MRISKRLFCDSVFFFGSTSCYSFALARPLSTRVMQTYNANTNNSNKTKHFNRRRPNKKENIDNSLSIAASKYLTLHVEKFQAIYPDVITKDSEVKCDENTKYVTVAGASLTPHSERYDEIMEQKWRELMKEKLSELGDTKDVDRALYGQTSNIPCCGCGAILHCARKEVPGFITPQEYEHYMYRQGLHNTKCIRCQLISDYNVALNADVGEDVYNQILSDIRQKTCLLLILVDLLDMPCSLYPKLHEKIGLKNKAVFLLGNKVDLLPMDSRQYLKNAKESLLQCVERYSGLVSHDIQHAELISAKTGYGIEQVIDKIYSYWGRNGDIYILGCSNVGKSSLFNQLLSSDLCVTSHSDVIDDAVVSLWPGTTLNTVKFPIIEIDGGRKYHRYMRRKMDMELERRDMNIMMKEADKLEKVVLPTHQESVGRSFARYLPDPQLDPNILHRGDPFSYHVNDGRIAASSDQFYSQKMTADLQRVTSEKPSPYWVYDTPGFINDQQISDRLTTTELSLLHSDKIIYPKIFTLVPRTSILVTTGTNRLYTAE